MAQYNGYVELPHSTYDEWRTATLGSGFNYDASWGNQCWDYVQECYAQYGLNLYTKPGGGGACECWLTSKNRNAVFPFEAIEGKENIKRGDIIVTNRSSFSSTGHICFADEDYNGTDILRTLGQVPSIHGVNGVVSVDNIDIIFFLGIFRNTTWQSSPQVIMETKEKTKKFPWVVAWNNWEGYRH